MSRILSISTENQDSYEEINKIVTRYPIGLQPLVKEAFQEAEKENYEKAVELCRELLDQYTSPEVRMLLGTCYFIQDHMQDAKQVFSDLMLEYPKEETYRIYLGMTDHALGRYKEAVKELGSLYPLNVYRPFYYSSYGDSLMQTGKLKQSRDAFYREVEFFKKTGTILSSPTLDGAFQNLLYLDITLGNGKYPEDIQLYYDFLDQAEMTEEMQGYLAENIVYFNSMMSNKWYRPLFLEFITHIKNRGFLTSKESIDVLEAAFVSWELYAYHDDQQISQMMEACLSANYERKYSDTGFFPQDERTRMEVLALTVDWHMCQYIPEHMEEVSYVKENYPHTYADNKDFFEKIKNDAAGTAEKIEDELYSYVKNSSRQEFHESMHRAYKKACENKKEPMYVYDGRDSYRRIQPKVGRNDPCPCGSGKKYKKCCGK